MKRSTKEYRPPVADRVARQPGGAVEGPAPAEPLRSPEEELATRASRYRQLAALLDEWRAEDEACEGPALDHVEPLRLQRPGP